MQTVHRAGQSRAMLPITISQLPPIQLPPLCSVSTLLWRAGLRSLPRRLPSLRAYAQFPSLVTRPRSASSWLRLREALDSGLRLDFKDPFGLTLFSKDHEPDESHEAKLEKNSSTLFTTETRSTRRCTENADASVKSPCPPCLRGETGRLAAQGRCLNRSWAYTCDCGSAII